MGLNSTTLRRHRLLVCKCGDVERLSSYYGSCETLSKWGVGLIIRPLRYNLGGGSCGCIPISLRGSLKRRRLFHPALLGASLFLVALLLRIWLSGGSLPYVEHIDEPAVLETAIRMLRDGDPNPHTFRYPSLYYYLLTATTRLHVEWGIQAGLYQSDQDLAFKQYGVAATPQLYIWGRNLTALLGAATVPALFVLGWRMFDLRVGLLAAVLLMLTAYHVRHSHYITVDVPTGLWVVLALLGAWEVGRSGRWRAYVLAAVAAGFAAGTKYNAGLVVVAIGLAHVIHWRRQSFGWPLVRLASAALVTVLAFLLTTPFALFDPTTFLRDLSFNSWHYTTGEHGDVTGRWPLSEYALFFWASSLYPVAIVVMLTGLPLLARRYPAQLALLLAVCGLTLLMLLNYVVHFFRNTLPILPLLILLVAASSVALADLLGRLVPRRPVIATLALGVLAVALVGPQARATYSHLEFWNRPHSMVLASEQLKALPQGARSAAEVPSSLFGGEVAIFPVKRITEHNLAWYRSNGFRYLLVNDDLRTPEDQAAYEQLRTAATVVLALPPRRAGIRPGPGGAILDLGVDPAALPFVGREMNFGEQIMLLGYEIQPGPLRSRISPLDGADRRELAAGESVQINLYWRNLATQTTDYVLFMHLLDANGQQVAQRDLPLRYEDYPTSHWQPGELVIERADLPLPALPPGSYQLLIGLYEPTTGTRLEVAMPDKPLLTLQVR